jgi:hypothetical protein
MILKKYPLELIDKSDKDCYLDKNCHCGMRHFL